MRGIGRGFATVLAVAVSTAAMMGSVAQANNVYLDLPQSGAEPVVLRLIASTPDDADGSDLLQVFVAPPDACCEGRTPITGTYTRVEDTLTFVPAYGFEPGLGYVVRVSAPGADHELVPFMIPLDRVPVQAAVTESFPSGVELPENVLRFYLHFSVPMAPHVAFDFITLRDASGVVDDAAFMRFSQELWNADRTRLTVLIDPGRIKRGVSTNLELGPALVSGNEYTLSVESGWPSADGASVLPEYSRRFTVGEALGTRPDVDLWAISSPCFQSVDGLTVTFDRPFDRHQLTRDIRVISEDGRRIDGVVTVGENERTWTFTPSGPWLHRAVHVVVSPELEDVAANNFRDLLDHAEGEPRDAALIVAPVELRTCEVAVP